MTPSFLGHSNLLVEVILCIYIYIYMPGKPNHLVYSLTDPPFPYFWSRLQDISRLDQPTFPWGPWILCIMVFRQHSCRPRESGSWCQGLQEECAECFIKISGNSPLALLSFTCPWILWYFMFLSWKLMSRGWVCSIRWWVFLYNSFINVIPFSDLHMEWCSDYFMYFLIMWFGKCSFALNKSIHHVVQCLAWAPLWPLFCEMELLMQNWPLFKSQVAIFVVVAMVLRKKPDVLISILPTLRENSKYQGQDKLPVIVWAVSQVSG